MKGMFILYRKNIQKNLILVLFSIALFVIISSYTHYRSNKVTHSSSNQVEYYLENISEEPILLSRFLNFEWDEVYIIGPYTPNKKKHEIVGTTWYTNGTYIGYILDTYLFYDGEILADSFQELVFTRNNKVISTALLERRNGDFLNLEQHVYNSSNAKFIIEKDEYFFKRVIHSQ